MNNKADPAKNYAAGGFKRLRLSTGECWIRWQRKAPTYSMHKHLETVLVPQIFWIH